MDLLGKMRGLVTERSREARLRQLLAILGAVLIAGAAFDGLCALWAEGKPQVQAAIVGGAFTLLAAIGGVVVV
ncbi:hypothetical protein B7486_75740, partial [cyanobacterium TDX16]